MSSFLRLPHGPPASFPLLAWRSGFDLAVLERVRRRDEVVPAVAVAEVGVARAGLWGEPGLDVGVVSARGAGHPGASDAGRVD